MPHRMTLTVVIIGPDYRSVDRVSDLFEEVRDGYEGEAAITHLRYDESIPLTDKEYAEALEAHEERLTEQVDEEE